MSLPAFRCGQRLFQLSDIFLAAELSGSLAEFRVCWAATAAACARADSLDLEPDSSEVESAIDEFRYARDLVSAEECDRWLAQRGLVFEDLSSTITRRLQSSLVDEGAEEDEPIDPDPSLFFADTVLDDLFPVWARRLAHRLAVAAENNRLPAEDADLGAAWQELDSDYQSVCAGLVSPESRQRALQQLWLNLTLLQFEAAEFDSLSAAREAVCCIREDGSSLVDVAGLNGLPCRSSEAFLESLPAEWKQELAAARSGDVVLVASGDSSFVVLRLLSRREPSLEEDAVREQIDARLVSTHFNRLESAHVHWLINMETGE